MAVDQEKEAFNLITSDRFYKRFSKILDFALTFSALDPFAPIRDNGHRGFGWKRWTSERWLKFSVLATIYLAIKPLTTLLLRTIRSRLSADEDSRLIDSLNWLLKLVGDPYSSPPFLNLVFYLFFPILGLWLRCYLPIYVKYVQAYDCSLARFILAPTKEIRRFDLEALDMVNSSMEALEHERRELAHSLRFESHFQRSPAFSNELPIIQHQLSQMRRVGQQIHRIRPNTLGSIWHKHISKITVFMVAFVTAINIFVISLGVLHFAWIGWRGRCSEFRLLSGELSKSRETKCSLFDAFNTADVLMVVEIVLLSQLPVSAPVSLLVVFHTMQIYHQLHLTKDIIRRLNKLLLDSRIAYQSSRVSSNGAKSPIDQLTSLLFANLISLRMFERESRKCVTLLAHTARIAIVCGSLFTFVAFASLRLQTALDRQISLGQVDITRAASVAIDRQSSMVVLAIGWTVSILQQTGMLFSCAIIPAQLSRVERTVYSLMAHLVLTHRSYVPRWELEENKSFDGELLEDDSITSLWRRLVLSRKIDRDLPVVRVFTISLTYGRVLKLQFYNATIILMLYSYL